MKPDFLIIPKPVYECKELTHLDSKLYAVIYWYSKLKEGKCIASNQSLAKVLEIGYSTVNECLTRLEKNGFIKRIYLDKERNERSEIIPMVLFSREEGVSEIQEGGSGNSIQSSKSYKEDIILKYNMIDSRFGNTPLKRILNVYSLFWRDKFGFPYKVVSWGKLGKTIKSLLSQYDEYQIALLLSVHFEWRGVDNSDEKMYNWLSGKAFPLEMLLTNHNVYCTYIINVLKLNMTDASEVKKYVDNIIKNLNQII